MGRIPVNSAQICLCVNGQTVLRLWLWLHQICKLRGQPQQTDQTKFDKETNPNNNGRIPRFQGHTYPLKLVELSQESKVQSTTCRHPCKITDAASASLKQVHSSTGFWHIAKKRMGLASHMYSKSGQFNLHSRYKINKAQWKAIIKGSESSANKM